MPQDPVVQILALVAPALATPVLTEYCFLMAAEASVPAVGGQASLENAVQLWQFHDEDTGASYHTEVQVAVSRLEHPSQGLV